MQTFNRTGSFRMYAVPAAVSMRPLLVLITIMVIQAALAFSAFGASLQPSGLWTKTTHPDPHNITIFYSEGNLVKAVGYGRIQGASAIWYAEGRITDGGIALNYRYSLDALPEGWEPRGTIQLDMSADGDRMTGSARSTLGSWSGPVAFKRIAPL